MSIPRNYGSFDDLQQWIEKNLQGAQGNIKIVWLKGIWVLSFAEDSDATMFQLKWPSENAQPTVHI